MEIITVGVIEAIGKQVEPNSVAMDSEQLESFHSMINTVCNKQMEIATLEYNMKKIEVLKSLIQSCIEKGIQDNNLAFDSLVEKLNELL